MPRSTQKRDKSAAIDRDDLCESRLWNILELPLDYIHNDAFEQPFPEAAILGPLPEVHPQPDLMRASAGLSSYLASLYKTALLTPVQERHLFRQYNYLKYSAAKRRAQLDRSTPDKQQMDRIEDLFRSARATRNWIICANLRLVVCLAKRRATRPGMLQELVSDGNVALMQAVEKFDYARGNKFSTYATWCIIRYHSRTIAVDSRRQGRFHNGMEDLLAAAPDGRSASFDSEDSACQRRREVVRILRRLTDREKHIIVRRFGIGCGRKTQTLQDLGEELGVTKERVRQLERRAISKLQSAMVDSAVA